MNTSRKQNASRWSCLDHIYKLIYWHNLHRILKIERIPQLSVTFTFKHKAISDTREIAINGFQKTICLLHLFFLYIFEFFYHFTLVLQTRSTKVYHVWLLLLSNKNQRDDCERECLRSSKKFDTRRTKRVTHVVKYTLGTTKCMLASV